MRKLFILTIILLGAFALKAQEAAPKFTVTPSEIDALTENVTIEFDVTGSVVEGLSDVYIWAWAPGLTPSEILLVYDQGSPSWGSISDNAKLDPVAGQPNKFTLTLPKTVTRAGVEVTFNNIAELFGVGDTPGKIKELGFLLRSQDGSKQTPGDMATSISLLPLEFEASYFRTFPAKVSKKDVVTAYLNLSMIESSEDQKLSVADSITAVVTLMDEDGATLVTSESMKTTFTSQNEYAFSFLSDVVGEFPEGKSIDNVTKCNIVFSGKIYNQNGSTEVVSTKAFEFEFQVYE
nr:hypothetical protein [uncultured Draconibacterium sp.]